MTPRPRPRPRLLAYYGGKVVDMHAFCDAHGFPGLSAKSRFSLACMRVTDNERDGYVLEGEKLYRLTRSSRKVLFVADGDERTRVLAEILGKQFAK